MNEDKKFVVNLAPGMDKIHIIESQMKLAGEYEYHYQGFQYEAYSTRAVIDLIKHLTKNTPDYTIIFYTDSQIVVIVDETIRSRPQDKIKYSFAISLELQEWERIFNKSAISQKEFIDFLKRRPEGEIADCAQLLAAVQTIKLATEISGDFIYEDNNNVTVAFKIKDATSATTFPASFEVYLPLIHESGKIDEIEVELQVNKPTAEGQKLTFSLSCPKLPMYWQNAVKAEIETLRKELPGYLIVAGSPY